MARLWLAAVVCLDHGGVLLGALVHVLTAVLICLEAGRLFARGFYDGGDVLVDLLHLATMTSSARPVSLTSATPSPTCWPEVVMSALISLARGIGRALRELPHLLRHDGEALAGLAGARCLHAGVERQEVGLEGDLVDDADDLGDLAGGLLDLLHRLHRVAHDLARCSAPTRGPTSQLAASSARRVESRRWR